MAVCYFSLAIAARGPDERRRRCLIFQGDYTHVCMCVSVLRDLEIVWPNMFNYSSFPLSPPFHSCSAFTFSCTMMRSFSC